MLIDKLNNCFHYGKLEKPIKLYHGSKGGIVGDVSLKYKNIHNLSDFGRLFTNPAFEIYQKAP